MRSDMSPARQQGQNSFGSPGDIIIRPNGRGFYAWPEESKLCRRLPQRDYRGACNMMHYNEGSMDWSAVEKLAKHADVVYMRGQVSNVLVALDLYTARRNTARAKAYAARFLATLRKNEDMNLLKTLLESSDKVSPPPDFDKRVPEVTALLRAMERDNPLDEKSVSSVKAFLVHIEEDLAAITQEQEGLPFEPWRFGP